MAGVCPSDPIRMCKGAVGGGGGGGKGWGESGGGNGGGGGQGVRGGQTGRPNSASTVTDPTRTRSPRARCSPGGGGRGHVFLYARPIDAAGPGRAGPGRAGQHTRPPSAPSSFAAVAAVAAVALRVRLAEPVGQPAVRRRRLLRELLRARARGGGGRPRRCVTHAGGTRGRGGLGVLYLPPRNLHFPPSPGPSPSSGAGTSAGVWLWLRLIYIYIYKAPWYV